MKFSLFEKILGIVRKKERFFVVELFRHGVRATPVRLDAEGRRLLVYPGVTAAPGDNLGAFVRRLRGIRGAHVIVSCDGAIATTAHRSVAIEYGTPRLLDEAALQHVVSQAIWKSFDGERAMAAKKMGIAGDEVQLADARIWRVALDGRDVVNPEGYSARTVDVVLSVTMMPRAQFAMLARAFGGMTFAVNEAVVSWARLRMASAPADSTCVLAGLFPQHAVLAVSSADVARYHDAFEWGEDEFMNGVAGQLAVTSDIAQYIVRMVREGARTSPLFAKKVEGIITAELQMLLNGLQAAVQRTTARTVHVLSFYDLPRMLFAATLRNASRRIVVIEPMAAETIGNNFGFTIQWKMCKDEHSYAGVVASLFDDYIAPKYPALNAIARQRMRWLGEKAPEAPAPDEPGQ